MNDVSATSFATCSWFFPVIVAVIPVFKDVKYGKIKRTEFSFCEEPLQHSTGGNSAMNTYKRKTCL